MLSDKKKFKLVYESTENNKISKVEDELKSKSNMHLSSIMKMNESMAVEALNQLRGENKIDSEKSYMCTFCNIHFATKEYLDNHNCLCFENITYFCDFCEETFSIESKLAEHYRHYHLQNIQICMLCDAIFLSKEEYKNHLLTHKIDNCLRCIICQTDFQRPSSLTNHMKIHNYSPGRAVVETTKRNTNICDIPLVPVCEQLCLNEKLDDKEIKHITETVLMPTDNTLYNFSHDIKASCSELGVHIPITDNVEKYESVCIMNDLNLVINEDNLSNNQFFYDVPVKTENILKSSASVSIVNQFQNYSFTVREKDNFTYICSICGIQLSDPNTLETHENLHKKSDLFTNNHSTDFNKNLCLDLHVIVSEENKVPLINNQINLSMDIDYQNYSTNSSYNLNSHETKTKVAKHACSKCDKKFATKQKMFRHMWIHRRKTFMCEVCGASFAVQSELDGHRLAEHPAETPHACQECGKCFASRQGLWEHGRVHGSSTSGIYKCKECNKSFTSRQGFLIHTRTHTGERPYGCRYCWKAFRDGGTLRKHERIHTGERPHACPLCSRAFNQKVVLREHVRWVHAEIKNNSHCIDFHCQLCGHNFNDREELCAHIVKHSDQIAALAKENALKSNNNQDNNTTTSAKMSKKKQNESDDKTLSTFSFNQTNDEIHTDINSEFKNVPVNNYETTSVQNKSCDMCGEEFSNRDSVLNHIHIHV